MLANWSATPRITPLYLQVIKVAANGFDKVVVDDVGPNAMVCIVPHEDYIGVGAVITEGSEKPFVNDFDTLGILERASKVHPDFRSTPWTSSMWSPRRVPRAFTAPRPRKPPYGPMVAA
ncbi:MAG: hypothetical protein R3C24_20155 [Cyanobacteriota/Melainabacteria group bacterium]